MPTRAFGQGNQNLADFIVQIAVEKSSLDRKIVRENYTYDKTSSGDKEGKGDGIGISELFRAGRYRYEVSELVMFEGQPAHIINFFPKPKREKLKAPAGSSFKAERRNEILNCLEGTLHISTEDFGIMRVVAKVNDPPESIWTTGRLYRMDIIIEQIKIDDVWALKNLSGVAEYSYFFGFKREKEDVKIEINNFRLKTP